MDQDMFDKLVEGFKNAVAKNDYKFAAALLAVASDMTHFSGESPVLIFQAMITPKPPAAGGPSQADVDVAIDQVKRELEHPAMAQAIFGESGEDSEE